MASDSSKYYGENGVHRVPLWRIAGFALNNTATNMYLFFMGYVAYYLTGFVGVGVFLASNFSMIMRIWDGVTDPFIGFIVDKTNGRFGKNRPFMVIGQAILFVTSFILFHVTHNLPEGGIRVVFFIIMSSVYYLGYTFQCICTKSAQTCLTNDPKQRPLFALFDGIYNVVLFTGMGILAPILVSKYEDQSFYHTEFFHELWVIVAIGAAICTCIAVISIAPKDRSEFFGTGKVIKVGLKDYWDTLKNNRAIQMLVVSASTDKLASSARTSAVTAVMFGVVAGNFALSGILTGMTSIPTMILMLFGIGGLATTLGQRKAMLIGTWGGIVTNALLACLWLFGNPKSMSNAEGGIVFGLFAILHIVLTIVQGGFQGISGNIVIPMTADCADYEVYRTGKYVPGLMGTLFSFVDKMISSFAPMLAGLVFMAVGYTEKLPDAGSPYTPGLHYATIFLSYGVVIIGLLCNIIAMKFYPLTKEKMAEIQEEIAAIKAEAMKG